MSVTLEKLKPAVSHIISPLNSLTSSSPGWQRETPRKLKEKSKKSQETLLKGKLQFYEKKGEKKRRMFASSPISSFLLPLCCKITSP